MVLCLGLAWVFIQIISYFRTCPFWWKTGSWTHLLFRWEWAWYHFDLLWQFASLFQTSFCLPSNNMYASSLAFVHHKSVHVCIYIYILYIYIESYSTYTYGDIFVYTVYIYIAKSVSAVQCCIIPLHIPACIWLKARRLQGSHRLHSYYCVLSVVQEKRVLSSSRCQCFHNSSVPHWDHTYHWDTDIDSYLVLTPSLAGSKLFAGYQPYLVAGWYVAELVVRLRTDEFRRIFVWPGRDIFRW